jgi:signal transduction histidine kinase
VNFELQRFIDLQDEWTRISASRHDAGIALLNTQFKADMDKWAQDYPELKLADWQTSQAEIMPDGKQILPPGRCTVPTPPKWFLELGPRQKDLWRDLRSASNPAEIEAREEAFLANHPSDDARLAALDVTNSPEQLLGASRPLATESGISFQDVACFRFLSAADARLSGSLLNSVSHQVIENPSFVAPKLLALAEGLTNRADADICRRVTWMRIVWNEQSRTTKWLESIRRLPELHPWKSSRWSHWTDDDEALAIISSIAYVDSPAFLVGGPLSGPGYQVRFIPRAVVEAIFEGALAGNRYMVPAYAKASISVVGRPLQRLDASAIGDKKDLLGHAVQTAGAVLARDSIPFDLNLYLTSKDQMLSTGHRRARLFAGLILGAVFAAVAGLVSARRAFYRQLLLSEMKSNFVSSVSHELRAPIASVRLMAENLERGKIPEAPRQREYFRFIVQECRRLSSLIENVLDFARIEQGRKQYEFEPTDLVALAQITVKLMEPSATEKEVTLATSGIPSAGRDGDGAIELNVDGRAIQQALVNIIDNAVKHSPKGETVTVRVGVETGGALVCLSVADHGPGIPASEHERIFERFYRRGSELRRETQGVGIGLSVVQHIVRAHGGRIVVQSEPGKGSRFTIELPMRNHHE